MERTYDIHASYLENYDRGPAFKQPAPQIPVVSPKQFLSLPVRSRMGIAAGLLLNSKWILAFAQRGFDLLTYKTVRSSHRPCYPLPNWVFVEKAEDEAGTYYVVDEPPPDPSAISSSVCFGMPSMAPEIWKADIRRAKEGLPNGQILIVSVVATPDDSWTLDDVANDFVDCARWAVESGADMIEANFSCPNVCSSEGSIYLDVVASRAIAEKIRAAIGDTSLLIKTGYFDDDERLAAYLRALDGIASGVTLVNCIVGKVIQRDRSPVFGEKFVNAGVLGRTIHDPCVESVGKAAAVIARDNLNLEIAAVGGASAVEDIGRYIAAGANAVMMGSAPMYLPDLAAETKKKHPEW